MSAHHQGHRGGRHGGAVGGEGGRRGAEGHRGAQGARHWQRGGGARGALCVPVGRVRVQSLLFLAPVAEPDPDHLALHVQVVRHEGDLLPGRLRVLVEGSLQRDPDSRVDGGALLSPPGG